MQTDPWPPGLMKPTTLELVFAGRGDRKNNYSGKSKAALAIHLMIHRSKLAVSVHKMPKVSAKTVFLPYLDIAT